MVSGSGQGFWSAARWISCLCIYVWVCAHVFVSPCYAAVGNSNKPKGQQASQPASQPASKQAMLWKRPGTSGRSGCTETNEEIKSGRQTQSGIETGGWLVSQRHTDRCCTRAGMQTDRQGYKGWFDLLLLLSAALSFDRQDQVAMKLWWLTATLTWEIPRQ